MADTMQFDLVSPERRLASVQASEVRIPGSEGDLTAMPNHAPTITTLRPGLLQVKSDKGVQEFLVTGGFAEIGANSATVLAERALAREDVNQQVIDEIGAAMAEDLASAEGDRADAAVKRAADLRAAAESLGLTLQG